jgi:translation initiation factor 2-alpha kinase 4
LSLREPRFLTDNPIGKNKLKQIEEELKKLMKMRHDNLLSVFAVKLSSAYSEHDYPRLSILLEQRPSLSLRDVLEDCDFLREDRALVC